MILLFLKILIKSINFMVANCGWKLVVFLIRLRIIRVKFDLDLFNAHHTHKDVHYALLFCEQPKHASIIHSTVPETPPKQRT